MPTIPSALLLDEPLGALDLKLRQAMQIELKRIQREVGITFIYVTHDQEEALTMSDRIVVMNEGRVEQIGSPNDIYHSPDVGLRRQLHRRGQSASGRDGPGQRAHATVTVAATGPSTCPPATGASAPGRAATVMIRPERLRLANDMPAANRGFR